MPSYHSLRPMADKRATSVFIDESIQTLEELETLLDTSAKQREMTFAKTVFAGKANRDESQYLEGLSSPDSVARSYKMRMLHSRESTSA